MRLYIAVCTLWLTWTAVADAEESANGKILCYFPNWAVYRTGNGNFAISDIDPNLCTHLIYAFVGITEEGEVQSLDEWADLPDGLNGFGKFNALRENSSETKTLVSIGGWNEGSVKYSNVVGNATLRSNFATNIVNFVLDYGFDGFDINWLYPNQRGGVEADLENFVLLLEELRTYFDDNGLILSVTLAASEGSASLSYNIPEISKYVDIISLMTYEYHGSTESTAGHNTPLYAADRETTKSEQILNINASANYWVEQGAPAHKLVLGTAFFGKTYTLSDSNQTEPGSPISGGGEAGPYTQESGVLNYNEIYEKFSTEEWTVVYDEEQRVPYAYDGNQWVSYDDVTSITEKANYIKLNGFGGAMVWNVAADDFRGLFGDKYPLLNALNSVLRVDCSSS